MFSYTTNSQSSLKSHTRHHSKGSNIIKFKIGKYIVGVTMLMLLWFFFNLDSIELQGIYQIKPGDTIGRITSDLSTLDRLKIKRYRWLHDIDFKGLKTGYYQFTGTQTIAQFIQTINTGPRADYVRIKILEGRSIYDIQDYLKSQGYITDDSYLQKTTNPQSIEFWKRKFAFLNLLSHIDLQTLEGFLYPDTYFVDPSQDIVGQLITLQLQAFKKKVVDRYDFQSTVSRIQSDYRLTLTPYQILVLASIVEKEEKNHKNQPLISGLFYRRLSQKMRIDADISLCYGLHQSYDACSPSVIVQNLDDRSNPYNTRAVFGLPPTPISNPSVQTIAHTIYYQLSNYLFYLHDDYGQIYFAQTLAQHESNKAQYLR